MSLKMTFPCYSNDAYTFLGKSHRWQTGFR